MPSPSERELIKLQREVLLSARTVVEGRTSGGQLGSTITVILKEPIGGRNYLTAIAWTPCPPGVCAAVLAEDGNWYALSQYASSKVRESVRHRQHKQPIKKGTSCIVVIEYALALTAPYSLGDTYDPFSLRHSNYVAAYAIFGDVTTLRVEIEQGYGYPDLPPSFFALYKYIIDLKKIQAIVPLIVFGDFDFSADVTSTSIYEIVLSLGPEVTFTDSGQDFTVRGPDIPIPSDQIALTLNKKIVNQLTLPTLPYAGFTDSAHTIVFEPGYSIVDYRYKIIKIPERGILKYDNNSQKYIFS